VTRAKSGKNGKRGGRGKASSTAPPESGPPTVENMKAAERVAPPAETPEPIADEASADEPSTEPFPALQPPPELEPLSEPEVAPVSELDESPTAEAASEPPLELSFEPALDVHANGESADAGEPAVEIEHARELTKAHLRGLLEALVFASDKPMKSNELARLASAPVKQVREALSELRAEYTTRGIVLDEVAGGWLFRTNAQYAPFVRELAGGRPVKLSRAQVETLAIAAYRQPITRPEIDEIRGVDSGATLKLLLERDLVRILGKKDEPGRPLLYGTTTHFLEFFNMKSLRDLPTLREFTELSDESRRVAEAELGDVLPDMNPAPSALRSPRDAAEPGEPTEPSLETLQAEMPDDERDTIGPPPVGAVEHSSNAPSEDPWPDSAPPTAPTEVPWPDGEPTDERPLPEDDDG
jgi:segregation and condensation protein B